LKFLVVGGGGREHAVCRALSTSVPTPDILVAPGNAGTALLARNVAVRADDVVALANLACEERADLVIPGGEAALVAGLADLLAEMGIPCCGPSKAAARLEGSKAFARALAARAGVPSPRFAVVRDESEIEAAVDGFDVPPVVKADGLAAGKGVFLPDTRRQCIATTKKLLRGALGEAGRSVVLEERLSGPEASLFYACAGTEAIALPHARDHKRRDDGDRGPNTGGMGAVSPNPLVTPAMEERIRRETIEPVLRAMTDEGTPFRGFLFAGMILTQDGPMLLEFNVRLGDPEAQAILPRLGPGDFQRLAMSIGSGRLFGVSISVDTRATCAVVVASEGYPEASPAGRPVVFGTDDADCWVDHAGTAQSGGNIIASGGRVAAVVGCGTTAGEARERAYTGVARVRLEGMQFRRDIGAGACQ